MAAATPGLWPGSEQRSRHILRDEHEDFASSADLLSRWSLDGRLSVVVKLIRRPGSVRRGGILVAPTYRLAPKQKFPRQLEDVAAAIAWVFRNAAQFGIDRDRLVIGGHSAGGHLAA